MKAEQRKEIETNSMVLLVQRWRKHFTWRTAYYIIGTVALVITAIILYNYFTGTNQRARDAILEQLANASTPEKLKDGMESHRGTIYGSLFKLQLARYLLKTEGLPKLGTDNTTAQQQAANSIGEARGYYIELTGELQDKEQANLIQESWASAAEAEETLVGLPTAAGGSDSRGDVDKAVEYYEKAAAIFPDTDFSKRYKDRAEMLKTNKEQFVAAQKAFYKPLERPAFGSGKDLFGPGFPPIPEGPKLNLPDGPTVPPVSELPKIEVPPIPMMPVLEQGPEPRAVTPKATKPTVPKAKQ